MRKGFFFSIDTAFAFMVVVILVAGIFFHLSKGPKDFSGGLYLSKLANDALITLDNNKTLESLDESFIRSSFNAALPDNLAFSLNIKVYECGDQKCNNFVVVNEININSTVPEENSIISKRSFITFQSNRIKYFSIAELKVWLL